MVRGLNTGASALTGFNARVTSAGKVANSALGTAVPLGAAAAGLAIGKFAVDSVRAAAAHDAAFGRIAAISNAAASDIEQWRGEVMELSGETARAPQELADALFFLSSAGLESGQVMETLEMSAKAAAAGLGSTVDIANITASALNAYAESGLTAAQVTDTLVAAVREGRAEPEEFAAALGRILPIASQAGVTFDQVTASLASLSNIGLDVEEGVTAMRGVLQAIVAPGTMAAKAMASIGLSAQDMLDAISERGLLGALQLLDVRAKANTQTQADYIGVLRKVVPNVRALTGVLGLTGQEAAKVEAIYGNVANATGSLGEAFAETAETDAFKLQKAWQDLANVGQEVAADALPGLASAISGLTHVIGPAIAQADKLLLTFLAYKAVTAWLPALFVRVGKAVQVLAGAQVAVATSAGAAAVATSGLIIAHKSEVGSAGAAAAAERTLAESRVASTAAATGARTASVGLAAGLGRVAGPIALAIGAGMILNDVFYGTNKTFEEGAETISGILHQALDAGAIDIYAYAAAVAAAKEHDFDSEALRSVTEELERRAAGQEELNQATIGYIAAAAPVVAATEEVNRAQSDGASGTHEFASALELWAEISGESITTVRQAVSAFREDYGKLLEEGKSSTEAWGAVTQSVLQDAAADFASWREEAAGNLNFVATEFGNIASDFEGSAGQIAAALRTSLTQQRRFAEDINKILEDGTVGSKILAEQLLAMGPAGAAAARAIASASDETRTSIERSLATGQRMADETASQLQRVLVGTLKDIRGILEAIAVRWGVDIAVNDRDGRNRVLGLQEQLATFVREGPYTAQTEAETSAALAAVQNLYGALHALEVHNWKANVLVTTTGGSTGFHLLELLRAELESFETGDFLATIRVNLDKKLDALREGQRWATRFSDGLREELDSLVSLLSEAVKDKLADAWLDQAKAFRLQAKELQALVSDAERQMDKLMSRVDRFRDSIRSGFDFDLIGGAMGLGDVLREQQLAVLQAQLEAAQEIPSPDQALVDSLNAQIEALRDALIIPTAAEFGTFLDQQLASAQAFAQGLVALQAAGLNKNLLAGLAAQGPGALPLIEGLLAGGADLIDQFNDVNDTIADIGGTVEDKLIDEVFGGAIRRAQEHLDHLSDRVRRFSAELADFTLGLRAAAIRAEADEVVSGLRRLDAMLDEITGPGPGNVDTSFNGAGHSGSGDVFGTSGGIHITVNGDVTGEEILRTVEEGLALRKSRSGRLAFER